MRFFFFLFDNLMVTFQKDLKKLIIWFTLKLFYIIKFFWFYTNLIKKSNSVQIGSSSLVLVQLLWHISIITNIADVIFLHQLSCIVGMSNIFKCLRCIFSCFIIQRYFAARVLDDKFWNIVHFTMYYNPYISWWTMSWNFFPSKHQFGAWHFGLQHPVLKHLR